ncbi:MAG: endonuclease/exonuclease/phosphatase family protein [Lentisphaerae bacterium]|jgi:endonuclease/exonuclease/phosphatase family metal-dependent hydrolase|nr:endonuclease/exonuclease/phosphatase family protein [Lentisphaerota bacterium]
MKRIGLFLLLLSFVVVGQPIRVCSFNVRCPGDRAPNNWQARVPRMRAVLDKYKLDVIGMQEMTDRQLKPLLEDGVYESVGVGRNADGGGEKCNIMFLKKRFSCIDSGTFALSETPDKPGSRSWKTSCPRICTWARLKDKKNGKEFVFFNTHLDHVSEEARVKGSALILERWDSIAKGLPCFLTGDMNCRPNSKAITQIKTKLTNSKDISETPHEGSIGTFHNYRFNPEKPPTIEIDYVFVSQGIKVLKHVTINDHEGNAFPSDHFPVMAEVEF